MKRILIFMVIVTMIQVLFGQNTTLKGDGYTYIRSVDEGSLIVELYNKENTYITTPMVYKDTGKEPVFNYSKPRMKNDDALYSQCRVIVNNAFSEEHKQKLKNSKTICVSLYANSTTGKIIDVTFSFLKHTPYYDIPLSVYREIELNLKSKICFMPTEEGKKLNYLFIYWMHKVE